MIEPFAARPLRPSTLDAAWHLYRDGSIPLNGALDAMYDGGVTLAEARGLLDAPQPVSGIPGGGDGMTHFRYRWRKLGAHIHVNVWTAPARELTHGRNGTLVFREDEWEDFVQLQREAAGAGQFSAVEILREPYAGGGDVQ